MDKSVYGIQNVPFSTRTKEEQLKIIREGKPRPELSIPPRFKSGDSADKFDPACYDKETWLTACDKRNAFYCWPCLLFASDSKSDWVTNGFGDYENLYESVNRHKLITDHINAQLQLQLFVRQNVSEMNTATNPRQEGLVKRNRDLLRRVLDVVHYISTRSPHPPKNTTSKLGAYIKRSCIDALSLCHNYDLDVVAEDAIRLVEGTKLMTDIIKTLTTMVRLKIKEQMRCCQRVSLILSEHSDVSTFSKLSVVLRYVKDGQVHESFAGFVLKRDSKDADSVGECVTEILTLYEIEQKLVAFSCDGATLPTGQLEKLLHKIDSTKTLGETWHFVPCHFHSLDVVLEQSMSQHVMGALFFKTLASIKDCLLEDRKMADAFADFTTNSGTLDSIVDPTASNWDFAKSVKSYRKLFAHFFKRVVLEPEEWSDDDVARSMGIYKLLEEFEMAFMFELVSGIYSHLEGLIDAMRGRCPEDLFDSDQVQTVLDSLTRIGLKDFPRLWELTCIEMGVSSAVGQPSDRLQADGTQRACRKLFEAMLTRVRCEFEIRLGCRDKLTFFQYLSDGPRRRIEANGPVEACGRKFDDVQQLNKEIAAAEYLILSKPLHKVYEILSCESLRGAFGMVCELAEIILTMPCKAAIDAEEDEGRKSDDAVKASDEVQDTSGESVPPKRKSTKLDVINFWSTLISPVTNDWAVICIEQDILNSVMSEEQFFNDFLCRFQTLNSTLQLA